MAKKIGHVETETGDAYLYSDGSMKLDNSGYVQHLTPAQVSAAWDRRTHKNKIPYDGQAKQEILDDYADDLDEAADILSNGAAFYDGEYWDFGEELHIIPPKKAFKVK